MSIRVWAIASLPISVLQPMDRRSLFWVIGALGYVMGHVSVNVPPDTAYNALTVRDTSGFNRAILKKDKYKLKPQNRGYLVR